MNVKIVNFGNNAMKNSREINIRFLERKYSKNTSKNSNMLGLYLPQHVYLYLTLASMVQNEPIQTKPRLVLSEWYLQEIETMPINTLVIGLVGLAQNDWDVLKTQLIDEGEDKETIQDTFTLFKNSLKEQLEKRNIPLEIIKVVLNKLRYETYKRTDKNQKKKFKRTT